MDTTGQARVTEQRRPLGETLLWLVGISGSLLWVAFAAMINAFSHGDYFTEPSTWELVLAGLIGVVPPGIYVAAALAAAGLGRGSAWGTWAGRAVGAILVASLLAAPLVSGIGGFSLLRHLIGFGVAIGSGLNLVGLAALLIQALIGALVLWDLRRGADSTRTGTQPAARSSLPTSGRLLVALGLWQALLIGLAVIAAAVNNPRGDAVIDIVVFAVAGAIFAGVGILIGLSTRHAWSGPAVIPTAITLTAWSALITLFAATALLRTLTPPEEDSTDGPAHAAYVVNDRGS